TSVQCEALGYNCCSRRDSERDIREIETEAYRRGTETTDQAIHRESRGVSVLFERPLLLEQENCRSTEERDRIFRAGYRERSSLRSGLCRSCRLLCSAQQV